MSVKTAKIKVKLYRAVIVYPDGLRETYESTDTKNGPIEVKGFIRATGAAVESDTVINETYVIAVDDVIKYGSPEVIKTNESEGANNE